MTNEKIMRAKQVVLSSRANPLVKQARALRQRKKRVESGLFLVEGIYHVGEAVAAGWGIEQILYSPALLTSEFAWRLIEQQDRRGVSCQPVEEHVFVSLVEKENPQGILAIVRQKEWAIEDLNPPDFQYALALVSPQDPGNLGAILRTIDAIGAGGCFLLDGGVDPFHPSSVRASMGALFWKPVIRSTFEEFLRWARQNDCYLIGSSAHATTDYRSVKRANRPLILLLGSEQKGLTPIQMSACDIVVSLPMCGRVSSLNLAVAAGILLYSLGG